MKSVCSVAAANTKAVEDHELCNPKEVDEPSEETENMNIGWEVNVTTADADSPSSDKCAKQGIGK